MRQSPTFPLLCALVGLTVLAGCSSPRPHASPVWQPQGGTCSAGPAQSVVGQQATASVMEQARQRSGALMARILRPGQAVTKEVDAERLTLEVDAQGRIVAVRCG